MQSEAGSLPAVAAAIKRLLAEGKRAAAIRVAGSAAELLRLERRYQLSPPPTAIPVKPSFKKARMPRATKRQARRRELARMRQEADWRLKCVESAVCAVFHVAPETLPGRSQAPQHCAARLAFCCLARELVDGLSNSEVMRYIDRNHATLVHYQREFPRRMEGEWFATAVTECRSQLARAFSNRG